MKDQYVGDVNDYFKYALLRRLAARLPRTMLVCWMLTANDRRSDGNLTNYLTQPTAFRNLDVALFDSLGELVASGQRSVGAVRSAGLVPNASYYAEPLKDSASDREDYFRSLWRQLVAHDAVFFDPDNGLAVESVPRGRRNSSKYLYWAELATAADAGVSVLVYQHFPRVPRKAFIESLLDRLHQIAPVAHIGAVYNSRVAYLGVAQPGHAGAFQDSFSQMTARTGARSYWPSY